MPRRVDPARAELRAAIETVVARLSTLIGLLFGGMPAEVRAELYAIREPLERLLIRAGRRADPDINP